MATTGELPRESVTVVGSGTAEAVPDLLVATFGSEARAGTVAEALDGSVRALAGVIAALRAGGVADLDLTTGSASIWPIEDQQGRVTGYRASQQLTARLRDPARAGALVSDAVAAGGDAARLHGLSFELSDGRAVRERARAEAWQDAQARAGQLAALAGRTLGQVVRIREDGQPQPLARPHVTFAAVHLESAAVPIEPGTTTVTVLIEAEWAFRG
jgi:uncharacterized protein YggE